MKNILYPDEYLTSTYVIDFQKLFKKGYRGIIFDIDNTLVPHGAPADKRALHLFHQLEQIGFQSLLLSNNKKERVRMFQEKLGIPYIYKANKPNPENYHKAMQIMGTDRKNTLFIGDQIFTDIAGANLAGIHTILVQPMNPREEIQIVLKRYLEKIVLYFYMKDKKRRSLGKKKTVS